MHKLWKGVVCVGVALAEEAGPAAAVAMKVCLIAWARFRAWEGLPWKGRGFREKAGLGLGEGSVGAVFQCGGAAPGREAMFEWRGAA